MNGWQRLWVIATVLWYIYAAYEITFSDRKISENVLEFLAVLAVPAGIYLFAWGFVWAAEWVVDGFKGK